MLNGYTSEADVKNGNLNGDGSPNGLGQRENSVRQGGTHELSWSELLLDGSWHKVNYYVRMDSYAGAEDGVIEIWINDHLEHKADNIRWRRTGDKDVGFDWFAIGGNMSNVPYDESKQHQQYYAVDELKVFYGKPNSLAPNPPNSPTDISID